MTILRQIIDKTRAELKIIKNVLPFKYLRKCAEHTPPAKDFATAIKPTKDNPIKIIAELKKASPSKGVIRENFNVIELSTQLETGGAAAISVLTETTHFCGCPRYLQITSGNVNIPILRKDFIIDPYQIFEAKIWGADAILLIATALSSKDYQALYALARELGLSVLSEVHNKQELEMVLDNGVHIIGVNSRNLKTFQTDINQAEKLIQQIPNHIIKVAESGITSQADIQQMLKAGTDAFLIGETIMRAKHPQKTLQNLIQPN